MLAAYCDQVVIIEEEVTTEVEEIDLGGRPVIRPYWLKVIQDQRMTYGEEDLHYEMGDRLSYYGDEMTV